jgi:hypothetical protein
MLFYLWEEDTGEYVPLYRARDDGLSLFHREYDRHATDRVDLGGRAIRSAEIFLITKNI